MALIDFTPSNARRFYSSMGNPLGWKGLRLTKLITVVFLILMYFAYIMYNVSCIGLRNKRVSWWRSA